MTETPPLREYQRENVDWIRREKRGLLADEPGLGKSRSALEGFAGAGKVLIVAPSLVVKTGMWHDEVEMWGDDDCEYHLATYHDLNRRVKTGNGTGTRPVNALKPEWRGHWDAVIVDEAHYVKGRDTKWTWGVKHLSRNSDNLLLMTGTPIPNWAHEVFSLLQIINPEEGVRGHELGSFWRWAEQWFDCSPSRFSRQNRQVGDLLGCTPACMQRNADDPCVHYQKFAADNFGPKYMRHLRDDHLDLPPLEFVDTFTTLDQRARLAYTELRKNFATTINGQSQVAWSNGAKNVMLDRLTTSPWLLHKQGEPHGGKFDQLAADLAKRRGEPTLVLAHYRDSVEACARIAELGGLRSAYIHGGTSDSANASTVRSFKQGRLDVLVGSLETLAEGLTLTIADTAIFVERSYKPTRNIQATYRIHRLGQSRACTIRRYLTPNSIDTGKEELLNTKTDRQMRTLTAADILRHA